MYILLLGGCAGIPRIFLSVLYLVPGVPCCWCFMNVFSLRCLKCTVVIPRMSQNIFVLNWKSLTRYRCLWCAAVTREAFLSEVVWCCTRTDRSVRMPSRGFDESFPSGCISARCHFLCFKKKKGPRQKHPKTAKVNYVHWTREKKCNILLVKFPRTVSCGEKVIAAS